MPSFGRLSHLKHSNRSQQGLTSAETTGSGAAGASASGSGSAGAGAQGHPPAPITAAGATATGIAGDGGNLSAPAQSHINPDLNLHTALSAGDRTQHQRQQQQLQQHQLPPRTSSKVSVEQQQQHQIPLLQQQQHQHQHQPSLSVSTTSTAARGQGLPTPPNPNPNNPNSNPIQLYSTDSNPSDLQDLSGGGSPLYDNNPSAAARQQHQHPFSFQESSQLRSQDPTDAAAVARSQSQRYSTILPAPQHHHHQQHQQQQHHHHRLSTHQLDAAASSSLDDLPSSAAAYNNPANYSPQEQQLQQKPQAPVTQQQEKRSTRQLIRGIFSGSSRSAAPQQDSTTTPPPQQQQQRLLSQQQQQQQQQLDSQTRNSYQLPNEQTADAPRKLTKRISTPHNFPPLLNTALQHQQQQQQSPPTRDWQQKSSSHSQLNSPLHDVGEAEEYQHSFSSQTDASDEDYTPDLARNSTIRQVSHDSRRSPQDDPAYGQQHQQTTQQQQQYARPPSQPQLHLVAGDELDSRGREVYEARQLQYQQQQQLDNSGRAAQYPQQSQPSSASPQAYGYRTEDKRLDIPQRLSRQGSSESVSQDSRDSPGTDPDQIFLGQREQHLSTSRNFNQEQQSQLQTPTVRSVSPSSQHHVTMTPPSGGPPPGRRVPESDKVLRARDESPAGMPPAYRQSNSSANALAAMSAAPGAPSNPTFRGDRPVPPFDGQADQGRNSPQPSNPDLSRDAEGEKAFKDLLVKYKNVKRLYFDGKSQIDGLNAQVETLQNAVANQRMSQSRTAWDDNEYSARFNRLNGAINNLSFNIRKDWRSVPQWLNSQVSADALKTGKQEMTAVGRAVISRWLMEEVFNKCFHPGLDALLSAQLKEIELSIRGNSHTVHSQEEYDALTTKIVNWRMATLDGLQRKLNSNSTGDNRNMFTTKATTNLTACLYQFLSNPPPAGVEGSTTMIVELAVAIAANIPLESRDIAITYPLPGDPITPHLMEVEKTGLPSPDGPKPDSTQVDAGEGVEKDGKSLSSSGASKDLGKVRFAGFLALEVRGRQVLMKAPVWPL